MDPDPLASENPADLNLRYFQKRKYPGTTWLGFRSKLSPLLLCMVNSDFDWDIAQ